MAYLYNQYGVLQEEALLFIKNRFTDFPPEETDSLISSAYTHTVEFDTRKLNPTQTRILHIEQYISEHYETRYNEYPLIEQVTTPYRVRLHQLQKILHRQD